MSTDKVDWNRVKDAFERYRKVTGDTRDIIPSDNIITFLENEIRTTRLANCGVNRLSKQIERLEKEIKINNDFAESVAEAVQEMANRWTDTSKCIEQLGQKIAEPAQTFTEEKTSDGGTMTLKRNTGGYMSVVDKLLSEGYFVCTHMENDDNELTIEFWRA